MKVHSFRNSHNDYGFTQDRTGANLPNQETGWKFFKTIEAEAGKPIIALETDALLKGLETDGYYLSRVTIRTTTTGG